MAKGLKDRVHASRDIWHVPLEKDEDPAQHMGDVSDWLELPPDFRAPDVDGAQYRKSTTFDLSQATDEFDEAAWSVYSSPTPAQAGLG